MFKKEINGSAPEVRPLYALSPSLDDVKAGRFVGGPTTDLQELLAFGQGDTFLVGLHKERAPEILGHLSDQTRSSLLRCNTQDDPQIGPIPPSEEATPPPAFMYGRRP